jgi:hypothetical protein
MTSQKQKVTWRYNLRVLYLLICSNAALFIFSYCLSYSGWVKIEGTTIGSARNGNEPHFILNKTLPPVSWNSSWLGNQWITSQYYRLYSPREIREYFLNHSILVIGDSTARRQYATWYALVNAGSSADIALEELDHASVIDVNKDQITEESKEGYALSRHLPPNNKTWNLLSKTCLIGLLDDLSPFSFFVKEVEQFSLVVFVLGPWEYGELWMCVSPENGRRISTEAFLEGLVHLADKYPTTKFVWRTWAGTDQSTWQNAQAHNHLVKTLIQKFQKEKYQLGDPAWARISYVDWGQVMSPRVFPNEKRIKGDIDPHFGFEARSTFIQMLINHLKELEKEEHLNLAPGWTLLNSNDCADDCLHAGGSEMYCLNREQLKSAYESFLTLTQPEPELTPMEAEDYERAKSHFCSNCTWIYNIDCK